MKDTIPHLYSQLASVEIHLRPFPHHGLSCDHVVRHARIIGGTPPPNCDFNSQSQGRCWYFRTALETLSTQIGGEWSASGAKENYWTLLESGFDSGSTSHLFDTPGFDSMIATISWRQMHKTIKCCLNFAYQLQTNHEHAESTQAPIWSHGTNCVPLRVVVSK